MIVPMSKISVLGLSEEKEEILKRLMFLQCVQITDISALLDRFTEEEKSFFSSEEEKKLEFGEMLEWTKKALAILDEHAPDLSKKGFFPQKRTVSKDVFSSDLMGEQSAYGAAKRLIQQGRELEKLQNRKNQLNNKKESLFIWKGLPFPFESRGTKTTKVYTGTFPKTIDTEKIREKLEQMDYAYMNVIAENSENFYAYILFHRSIGNELKEVLREFSFNRVRFEDLKGSYHDVVCGIDRELQNCEEKANSLISDIQQHQTDRAQLQVLYDYLNYRMNREDAEKQLFATRNLFVLKGYLPADRAEQIQRELQTAFTVFVEISEVNPETDEIPTLLHNSKVVEPYEAITDMYSTPNYKEIDPNALMAPFYFLFFGMMVSDAGYGLVTALICWFAVKKYKPEGFMRKIITLIGFGGVSTLFWGIMFGGYFGDTVSIVTNGAVTIPPVLFNPLDDPMKLLILSFALGVIHIFVGIGAKVYLCFRRKCYAEGIANGCWIFIISGLPMLLLGDVAAELGKWMAIAGVAALILTKGWDEKNIFKKITAGISGLMDITGYFSDILSYSRLLALGLSTGVIASVVNTMGTLGGNSVAGWITYVIVFIIGHTFNMVINLLGAYVHTSRLQYVEFFGKFFEGGGIPFSPLRIQSKYIKLVKE